MERYGRPRTLILAWRSFAVGDSRLSVLMLEATVAGSAEERANDAVSKSVVTAEAAAAADKLRIGDIEVAKQVPLLLPAPSTPPPNLPMTVPPLLLLPLLVLDDSIKAGTVETVKLWELFLIPPLTRAPNWPVAAAAG